MILLQISSSEFVFHDSIRITCDPYSGATADMISFASQMTYEEFLNQSHQLSKIESYPQLTTRAEKIGFQISKVVYRGYQASSALQVCVCVCVLCVCVLCVHACVCTCLCVYMLVCVCLHACVW